MGYIDTFKTRVKSYGSTISDNVKNNTINVVDSAFANSPFYQSITINGTSVDCRVEPTDKYNIKTLILKSTSASGVGEIATIGTERYLILEYQNKEVVHVAKAQLCNHLLYWKDSSNQIKNSYCIIINKSSVSVEEEKYINLPSNQFYIILPANSDTNAIEKNKRFLFNSGAFKTLFVDKMTNGLVKLLVEEVELQANDIDGIADNETHVYILTILNGATGNLVVGSDLELDVQVTDNGEVLSPTPPIIYASSNTDLATVNAGVVTGVSAGVVTITAKLIADNTVLDTIDITVVEAPVANDYSVIISGDNELRLNQSKTFTANWFDNGVPIDAPACTFTINNANCSIVSQTDSACVVKGLVVGTTTLTCTLDADPLVLANFVIVISSLW
jgi:hypothetical protein